MEIVKILGYLLIFLGCLVSFVSAIGMLRFRDFYSKTHVAGLNDVFGCVLVLLGVIFLSGINYVSLKIILLIFIIMLASPAATFILARYKSNQGKKGE